ncbi:MoeA protein [Acinetobacter wuhouensis]|uniref:hypothetical protein n=1 Tax=Acinetobacter wuhouensis TaxID=1879050 RepID=UPI00083B727D|nr:hypothetical protein [Acinetobacter wuhouensis]AXQ22701.1 MoeA protein [Acinetobacter wuhouensis]
MNIKNKKIVDQIFRQLTKINERMPNPNFTEMISIEECLGRKLAEDVQANTDYPSIALSAIDGEMFNIQHEVSTPEQIKSIDIVNFYGALSRSENPFRLFLNKEYTSSISRYMKIGNIANTVIPTEQYSAWLGVRGDFSLKGGERLEPIQIGKGLISVGSDYKKREIILNKDTIITLTKKMLLEQAEITHVTAYKTTKFALLCVDYDLEDLNSNAEFRYIQECMKLWGFEAEIVKIKPFFESETKIDNEDDLISTIDVKTYVKKLKDIANSYDYIVACGLVNNKTLSRLGLMATNRFFHNDISSDSLIGNSYRMYCGELKAPTIRKKIKFTDEKGMVRAEIQKSFDDFCVITYLPGNILDIIINMHVIVKPNILNRLYARPFQPDWKIGILTHNYNLTLKNTHDTQVLWAFVSDVHYDGKFNEMRIGSTPELKIITVENERPDMLSFMKDCNCFIPISGEDNPLKAGDYLYYLEI